MAKSSKEEVMDNLSPEWNDYVMSQFAEDELIDGYPNVAGLRRLAEKFVGRIVRSVPTRVEPVTGDGLGRATVVYEVTFLTSDGLTIVFADVADSWHGNTDDMFLAFATAVAATRAEARALRKALKLKKAAAEEMAKKVMKPDEDSRNEDIITDNQKNFIDKKCSELDINVVKFMNHGEKRYSSVNRVLKSTASKMIQTLNELSNKRENIYPEIRGYQKDWLVNFN